jgi:hypothetical protein
VTLAPSLGDAEASLRGEAFDIVTVDMQLDSNELEPGNVAISEGWFLVGRVATEHPAMWVFVVSGSFQTDPRHAYELAAKYGVKDFATKRDFDPRTIEEWINRVRKAREPGGGDHVPDPGESGSLQGDYPL